MLKNLTIFTVVVIGFLLFSSTTNNPISQKISQLKGVTDVATAEPGETIINNVALQSDFTGAKVAKKDLLQGCFAKDCIPSIDQPVFETAAQADQWLDPDDRVFALDYEGEVRAYPQRILNWHEIVNDQFGEVPVAITFCPLCGSAVAFERTIEGVITEFGVSGKLHNNDLVMYDRYQGNLWQQITGEAIVGPAAREDLVLEALPITITTWELWLAEHPDSQVLSRDTGHSRNYDQYPYGTYEQDDEILFGIKDLDKSLQIKTVVYGVEVKENGSGEVGGGGEPTGAKTEQSVVTLAKAYPESAFDKNSKITDTIGNTRITLERQAGGEVVVTNLATGEEIIPTRLFWFAWAAFHPGTEVY
jgi:hypothetical protein